MTRSDFARSSLFTGPSALLLSLWLVGCASASSGSGPSGPLPEPVGTDTAAPSVEEAAPPAEFLAPPEIRWSRTAAEHRVIYETTYVRATDAVWAAAAMVEGPWGVVVDADETVLDNSLYQLERARLGLGYSSESWNAWVRREEATALPGAREFLQQVRELGGHVAVVTNRDEAVCEPTRRNLSSLDIPWDVVLCRPAGVSEKETRFAMVQEGTTPAGLPALEVVVWVGDNIEDFPGGAQALRNADTDRILADFDTRFFVLPNPMYGSWQENEVK